MTLYLVLLSTIGAFGSLFNSFVIDEERMRKLYGG